MLPRPLKRAKAIDRLARYAIVLGGIAVIATVIGMLVVILRVALPLFSPSSAERLADGPPIETTSVVAIGMDDYRENCYVIDDHGAVRFGAVANSKPWTAIDLARPSHLATAIVEAESGPNRTYGLLWDDGAYSVARVQFQLEYDGEGKRVVSYRVQERAKFDAPKDPVGRSIARSIGDEASMRVDLTQDGRIVLRSQTTTTTLLGESETNSAESVVAESLPAELTAWALDGAGHILYGGFANGHLIRWDLSKPESPMQTDEVVASGSALTALQFVLGDISIAAGDAAGALNVWSPTASDDGTRALRRIHELPSFEGGIRAIMPSARNKSLLVIDEAGGAALVHTTSARSLVRFPKEDGALRVASLSERGDGIAGILEDGTIAFWDLHNPHPETSARTLFGKVWYENYPAPAFTWQSSASTDDFEPKLSLVPLVFGSLKGTVYAMFFAVPLALFGALYTGQFASPRFRGAIKPVVEIMAAIPSVVIGFLVALWLSPLLERHVIAFFLALMFTPLSVLVFLTAWIPIRDSNFGKRIERGYEFVFMFPVLMAAVWIAYAVSAPVESAFFEGDFKQWLYDTLGERFDQRNAIVIAFGLGFAVIPIIFTMSEDAISNVPGSLRAASLALGASRWQTVWRVVLPSASPGIFAGIIIGFGRAVGETMIVLMATGNTPIMDWGPFNGMRTLSANIAVEIPEAPVDGTLYRVLFLSAVLLFLITSVLNTAAELIRQRLRKTYGQFQ